MAVELSNEEMTPVTYESSTTNLRLQGMIFSAQIPDIEAVLSSYLAQASNKDFYNAPETVIQ